MEQQVFTSHSLSKFVSVSNTLSFVLSTPWNMSKSSFNVKFCTSITSSGTSSYFCHHHSPHLCNHIPLTSSPDCIARVSNNGKVNNFFYHFAYPQFRFHCQHYHSSFPWCTCTLEAKFLFLVSISVKCYLDLSLGDKKVTQLHALLSVLEKKSRWAGTNHRYSLQEVTWLDSDDAHLLIM